MIKEIKKLLESLFDDDDDELFNDDNIGMTNDLLEDDARKIREQLLKGMVVSDDDLADGYGEDVNDDILLDEEEVEDSDELFERLDDEGDEAIFNDSDLD